MIVAALVMIGVAVSCYLLLQGRRTEIRCDELARVVEQERHEMRNLAVIARGADRNVQKCRDWIFKQTGSTAGR